MSVSRMIATQPNQAAKSDNESPNQVNALAPSEPGDSLAQPVSNAARTERRRFAVILHLADTGILMVLSDANV